MNPWLIGLEVERAAFRLALAVLCFDRLKLAVAGRLDRSAALPSPLAGDDVPTVTVQLPLRNEKFVAERLIESVVGLDWPKTRLQIQVLDDSDDETRAIVDRAVARHVAAGIDIAVHRRATPEGYKAGALAAGLRHATGEFIAMFDADSMPDPSFLRRLLPYFASDPSIGMVQGRWTYANEDANLLTRVQALLLDSLLVVEQPLRSRRGETFQFNGTAGVWRRSCIDAAGGWSGRSVTEDRDLSFRAILAGYRFVHAPEVEVKTELPESMLAFTAQQERWTRGSSELIRGLGRRIFDSNLTFGARLTLFKHLAQRFVVLFLAIGTITFPLTTFNVINPLVDYTVVDDAFTLFAVIVAITAIFARARTNAGRAVGGSLAYAVAAIALYLGTSFSTTRALVGGMFQTHAAFERTPKFGGNASAVSYIARRSAFAFVQMAFGVAYVAFVSVALDRGLYLHGAFCAFVALSYLWVGGRGVSEIFATMPSRASSATVAPSPISDTSTKLAPRIETSVAPTGF